MYLSSKDAEALAAYLEEIAISMDDPAEVREAAAFVRGEGPERHAEVLIGMLPTLGFSSSAVRIVKNAHQSQVEVRRSGDSHDILAMEHFV